MSSIDTDKEVVMLTNIKRTEVYSGVCADTGDTIAILEVVDLDEKGYSVAMDLTQVIDTIMLLCQLKDGPKIGRTSEECTLIETDSIEIMEMPEVN